MTNSDNESNLHLPFSQRTGLRPVPPQLKLGEISDQLRLLLEYCITEEIERNSRYPSRFNDNWLLLAKDLHVNFFGQSIYDFRDSTIDFSKRIRNLIFNKSAKFYWLLDFVEILCRHKNCSEILKNDLAYSFVKARAAYRIIDFHTIVAFCSEEEGRIYIEAIDDARRRNAIGARNHLIKAGAHLKNGKWADSIRESINSVEAVAKKIVPQKPTLGKALDEIEKSYPINKRLKKAFVDLYSYTNDENGIRHADVFGDSVDKIDEVDACFMLGACASFVSYLLARNDSL